MEKTTSSFILKEKMKIKLPMLSNYIMILGWESFKEISNFLFWFLWPPFDPFFDLPKSCTDLHFFFFFSFSFLFVTILFLDDKSPVSLVVPCAYCCLQCFPVSHCALCWAFSLSRPRPWAVSIHSLRSHSLVLNDGNDLSFEFYSIS